MSGPDPVTTKDINVQIRDHHCSASIRLPSSACRGLESSIARNLRNDGLVEGYSGKINRLDVCFLFIAKAGDPGAVITSALRKLGFLRFTQLIKATTLSELIGIECVTPTTQDSITAANLHSAPVELQGSNVRFTKIYGEGKSRTFYIFCGQNPSPDLSSVHIVALAECKKNAGIGDTLNAILSALSTAQITSGTSLAC